MPEALKRAVRGSAPGWPLVLYYHHVHPNIKHYTSLNEYQFEKSIETTLKNVGEILKPESINNFEKLQDKNLPEVLITFDDGYRDNIEYALPILDKYKIKVIFFISPSLIQSKQQQEKDYMSWADLEYLEREGHLIGAHTMTHPQLNLLSPKEVKYEIDNSIQVIKEKLHKSLVHFAYPYGILPNCSFEFTKGTLAFGTVKADAVPWNKQRFNIRRTYYPTNNIESWSDIAKGWREQWFKSQ